MTMVKGPPPADAGAYLASLSGWQRRYAEALRSAVLDAAALNAQWGDLTVLNGAAQ